jgi:TPR repeat protein
MIPFTELPCAHNSDAVHAEYELAARADHASDVFDVGVQLAAHDPAAARIWYRRAAEAGHAAAMINLGVLLAVDDPHAARGWFERAAALGLPEGKLNLDVLTGNEVRRAGPSGRQLGLLGQRVAQGGP